METLKDSKGTNFLAMSILVSAIIISGVLIYVFGPSRSADLPDDSEAQVDIMDNDPVKGSPDAPVTVVEFSDFQCPFCADFYNDTLPLITQEYVDNGKVKIVYRDFPLSIHPQAAPAALAAECANEQGKFWEYHDKLFDNQEALSPSIYSSFASELGLDISKFNSCVSSNKYADEIVGDFQDGQRLGVSGTPTFFVIPEGGQPVMIVGAQPYQVFKSAIDTALQQ